MKATEEQYVAALQAYWQGPETDVDNMLRAAVDAALALVPTVTVDETLAEKMVKAVFRHLSPITSWGCWGEAEQKHMIASVRACLPESFVVEEYPATRDALARQNVDLRALLATEREAAQQEIAFLREANTEQLEITGKLCKERDAALRACLPESFVVEDDDPSGLPSWPELQRQLEADLEEARCLARDRGDELHYVSERLGDVTAQRDALEAADARLWERIRSTEANRDAAIARAEKAEEKLEISEDWKRAWKSGCKDARVERDIARAELKALQKAPRFQVTSEEWAEYWAAPRIFGEVGERRELNAILAERAAGPEPSSASGVDDLGFWKERAGRKEDEVDALRALLNDRSTELHALLYRAEKAERELAKRTAGPVVTREAAYALVEQELRSLSADEVHLMYWDKGASETLTLYRKDRGPIGRGDLRKATDAAASALGVTLASAPAPFAAPAVASAAGTTSPSAAGTATTGAGERTDRHCGSCDGSGEVEDATISGQMYTCPNEECPFQTPDDAAPAAPEPQKYDRAAVRGEETYRHEDILSEVVEEYGSGDQPWCTAALLRVIEHVVDAKLAAKMGAKP